MVKENLQEVENRVQEACKRAGRARDEVLLIAVSKTKPVSMIRELMDAGTKDFGENKVQEMCQKIEEIPEPLNWHLIGHLQRNKVKYIVDKACLIHSVDSVRLAEEIQKEAVKKKLLDTTDYVSMEMNYGIDESLIGGMVIRIGDRVVDSSIKTKLEGLKRELVSIQLNNANA